MKTISRMRPYVLISLCLVFISSIALSQLVQARTLEGARALAAGVPVENDLFLADDNIRIDQPVVGDVFVLGNQVQVSGDISGSLFAIGQNVQVLGDVAGTTYVAAITLGLGPETMLERNLYYLGGMLLIAEGATIQRDLNTVCLDAKISGQVGRTTNAMIGVINLAKYFIELIGGSGLFSALERNSLLTPALGAGLASPMNLLLEAYTQQEPTPSTAIDTAKLGEWLLDRLRDFGLLLLLGAIVYWLLRKPLEDTAQALLVRPLPALGYGLLALLITTNLFLVGALVAALLFVVGLWLGFLGLWGFALAFWALSYSALAFIMAALWFTVVYGTKLIVAYVIGSVLVGWVKADGQMHPSASNRRGASIPRFVVLVLGLLVFVLLRSIPMLGWVLSVLVTAWGLGAIWLVYGRRRRATAPVTSPAVSPLVEPMAEPAVEAAEPSMDQDSAIQETPEAPVPPVESA